MAHPHVRRELFEVIENQLRDGDPPETRQTLDRLLAASYTREVAMSKIAVVLLEEMRDMLAKGVPFDRARFKRRLDRLS